MSNRGRCCVLIACLLVPLIAGLRGPTAAQADPRAYDVGRPVLADLYVSPEGSDDASGTSPDAPLQTLGAAWARIPTGELSGTGYRINLLPGEYPCEGDCNNYFGERTGTYTYPIVVQAAQGRGTVTLLGGLNVANVRYVYFLDLDLIAGGDAPRFANNVFHCEACSFVLLRGLTLRGPDPFANPDNYDIQEVVKANQSDHVILEDSDIGGTYQTAVDFVSVQHASVFNNRVHDAGEWCMYFKGGSAYLRIEANDLYRCGLGVQAGEGSNLEIMRAPWLQYEVYDLKFVNNVLHDIPGVGLSVAGGYNVLMAYNTLTNVGTSTGERSYPLAQAVFGSRGCLDTSENGEGNGAQLCEDNLARGGWGSAIVGDAGAGEAIPNHSVYLYNNLFVNPAPAQTAYTHFEVRGPITPPAALRNLPDPARADDNLHIRGNWIWNGPPDLPLGVEDPGAGCQPDNPACNAVRLRADNAINTVEPLLVDPAGGDYRLESAGAIAVPIPDFAWDGSPAADVPPGDLSNAVPLDRAGQPRAAGDPPGAYAGCGG